MITSGIIQSGIIQSGMIGSGMLGLGGGTFNPASLFVGGVPGYSYNFVTNSYTDTSRTTKAASGQAVAAFDDLSGNGNHVSQATAGSRAVLGMSAGFLSLEPDGVDDFYQTPVITLPSNKCTLFYGLQHFQAAPTSVFLEVSANASLNVDTFAQYLNDTVAGGISMFSKGTLTDFTGNGTGATGVPRNTSISVAMDGTQATSALRLKPRSNGVAVTPIFGVLSGNPSSYGSFTHNLFARNGASIFCATRIVGITCVGKLCSGTEIDAMERYYGRLCKLSF